MVANNLKAKSLNEAMSEARNAKAKREMVVNSPLFRPQEPQRNLVPFSKLNSAEIRNRKILTINIFVVRRFRTLFILKLVSLKTIQKSQGIKVTRAICFGQFIGSRKLREKIPEMIETYTANLLNFIGLEVDMPRL
jgi:hypothetical protein